MTYWEMIPIGIGGGIGLRLVTSMIGGMYRMMMRLIMDFMR